LTGKKSSLIRWPKPPKLPPQLMAKRLLMGPLGTGLELKKSLRLSETPPPKEEGMSGERKPGLTLTGRSVRNCLRLDQKPSVTTFLGGSKLGTRGDGTCAEGA
jgi:hypothetical protein